MAESISQKLNGFSKSNLLFREPHLWAMAALDLMRRDWVSEEERNAILKMLQDIQSFLEKRLHSLSTGDPGQSPENAAPHSEETLLRQAS